jgi:hypothetical protein
MKTTDTETYRGWENAATWNAHLWLTGSDYGTYQVATLVARRGSLETAVRAVEDMCLEGWGSETPDGLPLNQVDWVHLTEALRS